MVFCAAENHTIQQYPSDIAFPHQVELKCNDQEVKGNLRGLKNKPGSTRPADITSLLKRKIPHYNNTVEMVYALTTKVRPSFHYVLRLFAFPISKKDPHAYRSKFRSFTLLSTWSPRSRSMSLSKIWGEGSTCQKSECSVRVSSQLRAICTVG